MRCALPFFGLLILTACAVPSQNAFPTLPEPPAIPLPPAASSSSSAPTAEGDVAETSSASSAAPLSQRLLTGGLLEVGNADAVQTLLVFTNAFCNYCRTFEESYMPRLAADFVAGGMLRVITIPFQLKKYPQSADAAILLWCAAEQQKGQEMHALLFEGFPNKTVLQQQAKSLGLDLKKLQACQKSPEAQAALSQQRTLADALDVSLVPTFFLNGSKIVGLPEYADLRGAISDALSDL